jgi:hypothetical protein
MLQFGQEIDVAVGGFHKELKVTLRKSERLGRPRMEDNVKEPDECE